MILPKPTTFDGQLLYRLLFGDQVVTAETFRQQTGGSRLSANVHRLENKWGWKVDRQEKTVHTRQHTSPSVIKEYFFTADSVIEAVSWFTPPVLDEFRDAVEAFEAQ